MPQLESPENSLPVAEDKSAEGTPGTHTEATIINDGREDLTVFFSIGLVIDVLLVTAFLVWAAGQWRKKK
jgi:hypothetical protein